MCSDVVECTAELADGRNIDYEGPGGVVQIGTDGDPQRARFAVFRFDDTGADISLPSFVVTA